MRNEEIKNIEESLSVNVEQLKESLDYKPEILSDEKLDTNFLKEQEEAIVQHLYDIRYLCEEHYESLFAKKIEEAAIDTQNDIKTWKFN